MSHNAQSAGPPTITWDEDLMHMMMYLYQTRRCPADKKRNECPFGDNCFDSHESEQRRRPWQDMQSYHKNWNYSDSERCRTGWPAMSDKCHNGKHCSSSHSMLELNYHPLTYKTMACMDYQYKQGKGCSRGPKCWQYHSEQNDQRNRNGYCYADLTEAGLNKGMPPPQQYLDWVQYQTQSRQSPSPNQNNNGNGQSQSPNNGTQSPNQMRNQQNNNGGNYGNNAQQNRNNNSAPNNSNNSQSNNMNGGNFNQNNNRANNQSQNKYVPNNSNFNANNNNPNSQNNAQNNNVPNNAQSNNNARSNNMNGNFNQSNNSANRQNQNQNKYVPNNSNSNANNNSQNNAPNNANFNPNNNSRNSMPNNSNFNPNNSDRNSQKMNNGFEEKKEPEYKDNGHRNEVTAQMHNQWKDEMGKWFFVFKLKQCNKGSACPKGINCMDWHNNLDKRRPFEANYAPKACPNVYDAKTQQFLDQQCPNGDTCQYSHNEYEVWYHQSLYKVLECPYLKLAKSTPFYKNKECPFNRETQWFNNIDCLAQNRVKKVKGNIVTLSDKQHCCLDYCSFYHSSRDQRFESDLPFDKTRYSKGKNANSVSDVRSQRSYQQNYGNQNSQNNSGNQNGNANVGNNGGNVSNNNSVPPHMQHMNQNRNRSSQPPHSPSSNRGNHNNQSQNNGGNNGYNNPNQNNNGGNNGGNNNPNQNPNNGGNNGNNPNPNQNYMNQNQGNNSNFNPNGMNNNGGNNNSNQSNNGMNNGNNGGNMTQSRGRPHNPDTNLQQEQSEKDEFRNWNPDEDDGW